MIRNYQCLGTGYSRFPDATPGRSGLWFSNNKHQEADPTKNVAVADAEIGIYFWEVVAWHSLENFVSAHNDWENGNIINKKAGLHYSFRQFGRWSGSRLIPVSRRTHIFPYYLLNEASLTGCEHRQLGHVGGSQTSYDLWLKNSYFLRQLGRSLPPARICN